MVYGLQLAGTAADTADLEMLVAALPELVDAPWSVGATPDMSSVIWCEAIDRGSARALRKQGARVVRVEDGVEPTRRADSLLEAVPPLRVPGDPLAAEAMFLMEQSPRALLERLLLLGREDAEILTLDTAFCVRLERPPLYLLMRARDQPEEQTTAFALAAPHLWIEWSYAHPLASIAARTLERTDRSALIGGDGRWRFLPRQLPMRSIFEAIEPKLEAPRLDLIPVPSTARFVIPLRFAPAPEHEPELWLLDADRFFALEHFLQDASDEDLRRLTVARLDARGPGSAGPLYLLRERLKPGTTRLGTRLSDLVGSRGFAKNAGTENLFLPVGRRLIPNVGREELRRMLDLGDAALVIVDEDRDGPKILRAVELHESPITDWLDYVATDRRIELDRLIERTIFSFPPMDVERAAASMKAPPAIPPPEPEPRVVGSRKSRPAAESSKVEAEVAHDRASLDDLAEIREKARALEAEIAKGGCADPRLWRDLAELLVRLGEIDEAAVCLESALFFTEAEPDRRSLAQLVELRGQTYDGKDLDLVDLVVKEAHAPREAAYLGARFVDAVAREERLMDDMVQVALQTFVDPGLPVSRRLAWVALSSWYRSVDDKLGLTRAREGLLGAINDRGLSELYDLPRFVRYALALDDDERGTNTERARVEGLDALERLLAGTFGETLPELDALANYVRVLFATGMMRLGAASHARSLVRTVEDELPAHDAPNQILFRLYLARMAFEGTEGEAGAWQREVEQILTAAEDRARRPASWLVKRSIWLGTPDDKPEPGLRSLIDRLLTTAEGQTSEIAATLTQLATDRVYKLYDWELAVVIERSIKAALASGSDDLIAEVLEAAQLRLSAISILGHRVKAIAACLKAAATLDQPQRIEALVDRIIEVSSAKEVPWVRELLFAVKPCLLILRRLGAKEPASRLLESLEPVVVRTKLESSLLSSALADGYLQLDRREHADQLIERSLAIVFDPDLDYVARFEAGSMAIDVLRHWPPTERAEYYRRFVRGLDHFKDLYTTSEWFEAHKVLLLERIVDAMADSATRQSDRVQSFLDLEEHAVRGKIISDWKKVCGR